MWGWEEYEKLRKWIDEILHLWRSGWRDQRRCEVWGLGDQAVVGLSVDQVRTWEFNCGHTEFAFSVRCPGFGAVRNVGMGLREG